MKTNRNIEKHRESLKIKLSEYQQMLTDLESEISSLWEEYKAKSSGKSMNEASSLFRMMMKSPLSQKEDCIKEIEKIKTDLLEKKYANQIGYSDIEPFEVIEEKTPNLYVIRSMDSEQTEDSKKALKESFIQGGFIGHFENELQEWKIMSKEDGYTKKIRRHRDGLFYDANGAGIR